MVLKIDKLLVSYEDGKLVNNNINLEVTKGEILCIVGESGSGKTTLLKSILGGRQKGMNILSGSISLNGIDILKISPKELRKVLGKEIGLVPQNPSASFNPVRKYRKQIREAFESHKVKYEEKLILDIFLKLGLIDGKRILDSCPYEMSGGMNQRIAIAVAMLLKPSLLLCDEASSALDISSGESVVNELLKLREESSTSIIFITHNINLAARIGDRLAIMYKGKIIEEGKTEEIIKNPREIYTKLLFKDTPKLKLEGREAICTDKIIEASLICKKYKKKNTYIEALKDINFEVREGEILGIVGESGSGKSTLLRQLSCLENPTGGQIIISGECLEKKTPREAAGYLQVVFQDPISSFDPHLSIEASLHETIHHFYENIEEHKNKNFINKLKELCVKDKCCSYDHKGDRRADLIIKDLLKDMGLEEELLKRYPKNLSGGQCQRMAILRAISTKPKILLCDEATSSLDVSSQRQIVEILLKLRKKYNLSIIFVSHDIALVSEFCDKIAVMKEGKIVELESSKLLLNTPKNEYTKELLSYEK